MGIGDVGTTIMNNKGANMKTKKVGSEEWKKDKGYNIIREVA